MRFIGANNKLLKPNTTSNMRGYRAYFVLPDNVEAAAFAVDGVVNGIELMEQGRQADDEWFDMQGRKLNGAPTQRGLYIKNGKKTIVK